MIRSLIFQLFFWHTVPIGCSSFISFSYCLPFDELGDFLLWRFFIIVLTIPFPPQTTLKGSLDMFAPLALAIFLFLQQKWKLNLLFFGAAPLNRAVTAATTAAATFILYTYIYNIFNITPWSYIPMLFLGYFPRPPCLRPFLQYKLFHTCLKGSVDGATEGCTAA